jgi:hypothetical protein
MQRKLIFFFFVIFCTLTGFCQQSDYTWPLPEKWVTEIVPFPLKFAPGISYPGVEEIHFMPGWRGPDSLANERWSYTFVWYLDTVVHFDKARLQQDLTTYFDGLQRWVGKKTFGFPPGNTISEITIDSVNGQDTLSFSGTAKILDIFFSWKPILLNIKISSPQMKRAGKTVLLFELSPKPFDHNVWQELDRHTAQWNFK